MPLKSIPTLLMIFLSMIFLSQSPGFISGGKTDSVNPSLQLVKSGKLIPNVNFGNIPLYFIHNKGQVNKKALFYAKTPGYTLWITKEGLVFDSVKNESKPDTKYAIRNSKQIQNLNEQKKIPNSTSFRDVSRLLFIGANKNPEVIPLELQKLKVNYFKGNDKSKWKGDIPTSGTVLYKNIYNNIDLKVYGIGKQIEYDWIIHPGGNPEDIKFEYKNVKKIEINKNGDLDIATQFGKLTHKKPFAYQPSPNLSQEGMGDDVGADPCVCPQGKSKKAKIKSKITEIKSNFKKISETSFGFITGTFDKTKTLIIDPVVLLYSTYLGGSGNDYGYGIASGAGGTVFVTGNTSSSNFPVLNQYQGDQGSTDVFVSKINTTGSGTSSLIWSTYLGGGGSDSGQGIATDSSNNAYITGYTRSVDFPTYNGFRMTNSGNYDAFITKLSAGGNSLIYSTYLGGLNDDYGYDICIDNTGNAYVTGETSSGGIIRFPTVNAYQSTFGGSKDAFVTKLAPAGNSLVFSTFWGSGGTESGLGIVIDTSNNVYVTGNILQGPYGRWDAFVFKLSTAGNSELFSKAFGGTSNDYGRAIVIDNSNNVYITGETSSDGFQVLNPFQGSRGGGYDAFVTKISSAGSTLYSSYLGGSGYDYGYGIAVDNSNHAVVTGRTNSVNFPVLYPYQASRNAGYDTFVTQLSPLGNSLICSTYLGGNGDDTGRGISIDNANNVYIAGYTNSLTFPVREPFQLGNQGASDAFVAKLSANPDLQLVKIVDNTDPREGADVLFTITLTNNGPSDASGVVVTDLLPAGLSFQSANVSIGIYNSGTGIWDIGDVSNGSSEILEISASVPSGGSYTNTAEIIAKDQDDPVPGNESDSVTVTTNYSVVGSITSGKGSLSPYSQNVSFGGAASILMQPNTGYEIISITDNGVSQTIVNPIEVVNVSEDHSVEIGLSLIRYKIKASVSGGNGTVSPAIQSAEYGDDILVTITPDWGYEINSIIDNKVLQPISNPYNIAHVTENHDISVTFKHSYYPPQLAVTGVRKSDRAWLVTKEYAELDISITEHPEFPVPVSSYILMKQVNGSWSELQIFSASGTFSYTDFAIQKEVAVRYKFTALSPEGKVLSESKILEL